MTRPQLFGGFDGAFKFGEILLRLKGSHTSHAGGSNRLSIYIISHIAGCIDARYFGRG